MTMYNQNANYTKDLKPTIAKPNGDGGWVIETQPYDSVGNELFTSANPGAVDQVAGVTITGTDGSAVDTDIIAQTDVSKYKTILLQLTGTFLAVMQGQFSNDGVTWFAGHMVNLPAGNAAICLSMTTASMFLAPVQGKYFRLRVTSYKSGSPNATALLSQQQIQPLNMMSYNYVIIYNVAATSGTNSLTQSKIISAAGTNATVIKSGPGRLYELRASNIGSTTVYVKLFNATAITVGTTVPAGAVFAIPAGESLTLIPMNTLGKYFSVGISLAITGGYADTDTTAVAAGAVIVNYSYC